MLLFGQILSLEIKKLKKNVLGQDKFLNYYEIIKKKKDVLDLLTNLDQYIFVLYDDFGALFLFFSIL
jgi:hypothetical protein